MYVSTDNSIWGIKLLIGNDNLQKQRIVQTIFTIKKITFMYEVPYIVVLVIAEEY